MSATIRWPRYALRREWRGWTWELLLDLTCLMVGVNWNWDGIRACYVHVGPLILGVYHWEHGA